MKKRLFAAFSMLIMLFSVVGITSCTDETEDKDSTGKPSNKPFIILGTEKVEAASTEATYTVDVETNIVAITTTSSESWCKPSYKEGVITLLVAANEDIDIRMARVTVKGEDQEKTILVSQSGSDAFLEISTDAVEAEGTVGAYEVDVDTNIAKIEVTSSESWCVATYADGKISIEVEANPDSTDRTANITVKGAEISKTIMVTQEGIEPYLNVNTDSVDAAGVEGTYEVVVETNIADVKVTTSDTWCLPTYANGKLTIKVSTNPTTQERTATITVEANEFKETITVTQEALAPFINPKETKINTGNDASAFNTEVETNISEIKVSSSEEWLDAIWVDGNVNIFVFANEKLAARKAIVTIEGENITKTIEVTQAGKTPSREEDLLVKVSSALASAQHGSEPIENSIDGNFDTNYHSPWFPEEGNPLHFPPFTLDYFFDNAKAINYLIYHPRKAGSNGHFGEVEVWVAEDGKDLVKYGDYDFGKKGTPSTVVFTEGLKNPTQVRLIVKSGIGNFASCSQMEFFTDKE